MVSFIEWKRDLELKATRVHLAGIEPSRVEADRRFPLDLDDMRFLVEMDRAFR